MRRLGKTWMGTGLLAGFVIAAPALAQGAARAHFEPVPNWTLEIGGTPAADAEVLYSRTAGAFLVVAPGLPAPTLLSARSGEVSTVQSLKLAPTGDGGYEMLPNAVSGSAGSFDRGTRGRVSFQVGSTSGVLIQRPWLLGFQGPEKLRAENKVYDERSRQYAPDADVLAAVRQAARGVRVDIYFGEWCPHCALIVPRVLRVEEALADSPIEFRYYGLPEGVTGDPVAGKLGLNGVPTGIVYRDGKEVGRLIGRPFEVPEQALAAILDS